MIWRFLSLCVSLFLLLLLEQELELLLTSSSLLLAGMGHGLIEAHWHLGDIFLTLIISIFHGTVHLARRVVHTRA